MARSYPLEVRRQVIELARSGVRVAQLVDTFRMSNATIYNWLKQDRIDSGEIEGLSTDDAHAHGGELTFEVVEVESEERLADRLLGDGSSNRPPSRVGSTGHLAQDRR